MILFGVYRNTSLFSINLRWSCFLYAAVNIFIFVLQYLFRVSSSIAVVCGHLTNNLCHLFVKDKKIYNTSQLFVYFSSSWGIFTYVFFIRRSWKYLFYKGCGFHNNNWYMKLNLVLSCTLSAIHFSECNAGQVKHWLASFDEFVGHRRQRTCFS